MSIVYDPTRTASRLAPKRLVEKLVTRDLTLNRSVLTQLANISFLSKKTLENIALRVIKSYKSTFRDELKAGVSKTKALNQAIAGRKLMVSRVQNALVFEITKEIKDQYRGERYEWLPSDAEEPDPLHQLKYGKRFTLGRGEAPGDRYGCRCGMHILVKEQRLSL